MPGVNPTIFYIGIIVLTLAAGVGVYFKVIPVEIVIALISVITGHMITVNSVSTTIMRMREQRGNVELR